MPAVSSVPRSGVGDIDGLLSGYKWTSPVLTFSFPTSIAQYDYGMSGFQAMNAAQQTAIRTILKMYQAATGLSFTEVSECSTNHATLRFAKSTSQSTATGYYPSSIELGGDAWFNTVDYNTPKKGGYAWLTMMHEIGHTLGLDHGQDGRDALPSDHDSLEYSIMTYRSYAGSPVGNYTVSEGSYPTSLMLDDLAALQYMYGGNYNANSGATTYKWSPTTGELSINSAVQGASVTNTVFQTIWDGGGVDTYDFTSYTTGLNVDINPGSWTITSSAQLARLGVGHLARGNIATAYLYNGNTASMIENVKGGTGNDRITGNILANVLDGGVGNDTLAGGRGNDTIIGGAGSDTAIIAVNSANIQLSFNSLTSLLQLSSQTEGVDTLSGIETIAFADRTVVVASLNLIDKEAPVLVSASPTDGASNVAAGANIVLTFNELVSAGAGSVVIHRDDGGVAASVKVLDLLGLGLLGTQFTINPATDLASNSHYYVTIDATAFRDATGRYFPGISNATTLDFTTAATPLTGTAGNDTLNGTVRADKLTGLGGNDKLVGQDGNDTLEGGLGKDTMTGSAGADAFLFADKPGTTTIDTIADFSHPNDTIRLENAVMAALGSSWSSTMFLAASSGHVATTSTQRVIYDKSNGTLWYDDDGKGAHAGLQLATLTGHPANVDWTDFQIV
jgi:serralysin